MSRISNILTSQNTYAVLIAALMIALPLSYGFSTGVLIALLAVSLASLRFHKFKFDKVFIVPMVLYVIMIASLLWTDDLKVSLRGLERQLALILIPVAFAAMPVLSEKTRNLILYWFSLGLSLLAIFFVLWATFTYKSGHTETFFYHGLVSPLGLNAIYVSVFVSLSVLFLLFKQKRNIWSLVALAILSIFLLLLVSKIIIVATAIIGFVGMTQNFKRTTILKLIPIILGGIALLVFTSNPIKDRFQREISVSNISEVMEAGQFNKTYDWTGTTIRLFQARIFSEMLEEDPIFWTGYGVNNSKKKIIEKQESYNLWQGYNTYNFHNQYIQAFAELGIFGLLCLFLLLGVILYRYLQTKDILLLFLFFIMLVVFITESYIWRQRGLYHFLVLFCLFFKMEKPLNTTTITTNET
ncbi:MAG: O-antigen ligase family protein [Flavobacteriaceae bacterium]|nr:O-antigen ligase family protein [Flavobacteriaceae bacterium]